MGCLKQHKKRTLELGDRHSTLVVRARARERERERERERGREGERERERERGRERRGRQGRLKIVGTEGYGEGCQDLVHCLHGLIVGTEG